MAPKEEWRLVGLPQKGESHNRRLVIQLHYSVLKEFLLVQVNEDESCHFKAKVRRTGKPKIDYPMKYEDTTSSQGIG